MFTAVRIREVNGIQPMPRPAFTVAWRIEQTIDKLFVSSGSGSATNAATASGVGG